MTATTKLTIVVAVLAAGLVGWIIGGYPGAIIGFSLLVAVSVTIYIRSRRVKVDHNNVNAEWEGSLTAGLEGADDGSPPPDAGPKAGSADTLVSGSAS